MLFGQSTNNDCYNNLLHHVTLDFVANLCYNISCNKIFDTFCIIPRLVSVGALARLFHILRRTLTAYIKLYHISVLFSSVCMQIRSFTQTEIRILAIFDCTSFTISILPAVCRQGLFCVHIYNTRYLMISAARCKNIILKLCRKRANL